MEEGPGRSQVRNLHLPAHPKQQGDPRGHGLPGPGPHTQLPGLRAPGTRPWLEPPGPAGPPHTWRPGLPQEGEGSRLRLALPLTCPVTLGLGSSQGFLLCSSSHREGTGAHAPLGGLMALQSGGPGASSSAVGVLGGQRQTPNLGKCRKACRPGRGDSGPLTAVTTPRNIP